MGQFCSSLLACTFFSQHLIYQPRASCRNEPTPDVLGLKAERMCFSFVDQTKAGVFPMGWGLCSTQAFQGPASPGAALLWMGLGLPGRPPPLSTWKIVGEGARGRQACCASEDTRDTLVVGKQG